jgi:integrase
VNVAVEVSMGTKNVSGVRKWVRGGKPRWFIDFRYTDREGVRRRFRRDASVQTYAAALAEAARLMKRAAEVGVVEEAAQAAPKPVSLTYRSFVEGPFEKLYMPTYRPATSRRYRELHDQRVMAFFGEARLEDIGSSDYRGFAARLHEDGVQTKGPLTVVRTVLRAAHETGYLAQVPDFPRGLVVTSRKIPDAPGLEEIGGMLGAPGWVGLAVALAALAGLRMGEVRALEVRDVDFDGRRILVRRALSEEQSLTPKSGHERQVPLGAALEGRLREAVRDKLPRARVVVDESGQTPKRQQVLHQLKRFQQRNGLKERSFHSLRHFFISQMMRGGAGAEAVRVLAGHSKLEMTQRYAHAESADLRAAIDKLGG